jgi:hypothetical protein
MMPYQGYQQWAIERGLTLAEQRAADRRRGEAAAAVSGSVRRLRRLRLRVRYPAAPLQAASHAPGRARASAVACNTEG